MGVEQGLTLALHLKGCIEWGHGQMGWPHDCEASRWLQASTAAAGLAALDLCKLESLATLMHTQLRETAEPAHQITAAVKQPRQVGHGCLTI